MNYCSIKQIFQSAILLPLPFIACKEARDTGSLKNSHAVTTASAPDNIAIEQTSPYISCMLQDKKGRFWFGTNGNGICKYDGKSLTCFTSIDGIPDNNIRAIVEDTNGFIWLATSNGIARYNGGNFTAFSMKHGLCDNNILSLLADTKGNIWVGTAKGVSCTSGPAFITFPLPAPASIKSILEDREGNIWFTTDSNGVYCYNGTSIINIPVEKYTKMTASNH